MAVVVLKDRCAPRRRDLEGRLHSPRRLRGLGLPRSVRQLTKSGTLQDVSREYGSFIGPTWAKFPLACGLQWAATEAVHNAFGQAIGQEIGP
jgi:hypothetical protein